jgi:hypothetical protein
MCLWCRYSDTEGTFKQVQDKLKAIANGPLLRVSAGGHGVKS